MSKPKRWVRPRVEVDVDVEVEEEDSGGSSQTPKVDIISDLPDPLLCYILSFLPTRTAVATSVLSRRWRHVWEHLLVYDFRQHTFLPNPRGPQFPAFVGDVLGRRRVRDIHKFRLEYSVNDPDATANWIQSAVGPQLLDLHLHLYLDLDLHFLNQKFLLPDCVFTCKALVSLTLLGRVTCRRPLPPVRFPSLRSLVMELTPNDPIQELLSGCPVLETLDLLFYGGSVPVSIHVPPALKRLTVRGNMIEDIEIDTPKSLEYLYIGLGSCSRISCSNLQNVVEARVDVGDLDPCKLLRALCKTRVLALKLSSMEYPLPEFPEFCALLHLQLSIRCDVDWTFAIDLLHKCPMLQFFKILKTRLLETDEYDIWPRPNIDPKCVVSELTTFEFGPYEGVANEHKVIAYILQRGLVLKTVKIDSSLSLSRRKRRRIHKKLSDLPRGSNICQLELD